MDLALYISQFCKKHKITKEKLAKEANISRSTLYRMLEEDSAPTLVNLTKLAIAMQVHPQYLVKLEWEKYKFSDYNAKPINSLVEPKRWFHEQQDNSHFISETVPDNSIVCVNERFSKTWRMQNTGDVTWKNRRLECQDAKNFLNNEPCLKPFSQLFNFHITPVNTSISIPTTKPGEIVDLTAEFIAPTVPASVFSYWRMVDKNGKFCFPDSIGVYLQVQVISAGPSAKPIDYPND